MVADVFRLPQLRGSMRGAALSVFSTHVDMVWIGRAWRRGEASAAARQHAWGGPECVFDAWGYGVDRAWRRGEASAAARQQACGGRPRARVLCAWVGDCCVWVRVWVLGQAGLEAIKKPCSLGFQKQTKQVVSMTRSSARRRRNG
eukprot:16357-Chlamydomonas_euryale.AAC.1